MVCQQYVRLDRSNITEPVKLGDEVCVRTIPSNRHTHSIDSVNKCAEFLLPLQNTSNRMSLKLDRLFFSCISAPEFVTKTGFRETEPTNV